MTRIVLRYVILFASPPSVIHHVLSPKMQSVTLNVRNRNAKLNVPTKDAKCLIARNASQFANNPIASLTAKLQNQNASLCAKSPDAIGNAINQIAQNQNAS